MRVINSIKNITVSILTQIIMIGLGFLSRKIFLNSLGIEYLGINGLLTNVLSMLGLIEGGIGLSIVYCLYKPLAEDDRAKIIGLIQLYKKAYGILAFVFFILSLGLFTFLGKLIRDGEAIQYLEIIYFIFVVKNVISYFNAHKWSLINADQKGYVLAKINVLSEIVNTVLKVLVLILYKNYILYLLIDLIIFIFKIIFNGNIVSKRYPYIKTKEKYLIDEETRDDLVKNIYAIFLHNIGGYCVFGTDNILISSFISIATVGIYSNYVMIIGQLSSLVMPILGGIGASVGNLIATESNEKSYSIFRVMYLSNFWIYSVCVIFLYNLLESFINWWLGGGYLLDNLIFLIILTNFYLTGLRGSVLIFKMKAGLFAQDKYAPLLEGIINLVSSIVLVRYFELAGIFIGTTISTLSIVFWNQPRIVYKYLFNKPIWPYFIKYIFYVVLMLIVCFITTITCNILITGDSFLSLLGKGVICLIVPNIIYVAIFHRSEEFQYILNTLKIIIPKIRAMLVKNS